MSNATRVQLIQEAEHMQKQEKIEQFNSLTKCNSVSGCMHKDANKMCVIDGRPIIFKK